MANSIKLEIITPSKRFYSGEVEMVIVKTPTGEEGFMANHSWATKLLEVGPLWIQEKGSKEFRAAAVSGGYIDVKDTIIIFTDAAEWQEDIDMERAKKEKQKAENWLLENKNQDPDNIRRAEIAIAKSIARMKVGGGESKRGH